MIVGIRLFLRDCIDPSRLAAAQQHPITIVMRARGGNSISVFSTTNRTFSLQSREFVSDLCLSFRTRLGL